MVLLGFGVLLLVTASIAATWVESAERRMEREMLHGMHRRMLALHEVVTSLRRELHAHDARQPGPRA